MSLYIKQRYCDGGLVKYGSKTLFTISNELLGLLAFRDVLGNQQCCLVSAVLQSLRCYFDVNRATVF